ncbi:hypothetical protein ACFL6I_05635 [candidate division KSB1 bacterium]
MLKKLLLITLFLATLFGSVGVSPPKVLASADLKSTEFMFDVGVITHKDIEEQNWVRKGINFIFERVITIMAATIGSIAVLMMVLGGFRMIIYSGNDDEYQKAKGMMTRAAMGIVFVLGAYILVTAIQLLIKSIYG